MYRSFALLLYVFLLAFNPVRGQNYQTDTAFVALAQKNAVELYTAQIGVVSNVYNGSEYAEYRPQRDEHPYLTQDWIYGSVEYAGEHYDGIPLLYDISTDQLITVYPNGNAMQMIREKVNAFNLDTRSFERLNNKQVPTGFYERMYMGKVKFYARRQKQLYEKLNGTSLQNIFESSNSYYVLKDGKFHSFKSKGSLLKILDDQKAELKKFLRDQKIQYNANREANAVRLLRHYDQITN